MYEGFYRLRRAPFSLTPDPNHLFLSEGHAEALAGLDYFVRAPSVYACLLGASGLGKSTLAAAFLKQLRPERYSGALVSPATGGYAEILRRIALGAAPGEPPPSFDLGGLERAASERLDRLFRSGRRFVLVIDEAHLMPLAVLERLRVFVDHLSWGRDPLKLLLVGPPELEDLLRTRAPALRQRLGAPLRLHPLRRREAKRYLSAKITTAGGRAADEVLTGGAFRVLANSGVGVPRVLNALANLALLEGFADQERPVRARTARRAVAGLGLKPPPGRFGRLAAGVLLALAAPAALLALAGGLAGTTRLALATHEAAKSAERAPVLALEARAPAAPAPSPSPPAAPAPEALLRGPVPGGPVLDDGLAQPDRLQRDADQEAGNHLAVARP